MNVERVEIAPFELPLRQSLVTASTTHRERRGWIVRITDSAGVVGHGEATPLPSQGTESLEVCERALNESGATLRKSRFDSLEDIDEWLGIHFGAKKHVPAARHGVELALLDLLARSRRQNLSELLGGSKREAIDLHALLGGSTPGELAAEAAALRVEGFRCFKLKIGSAPLDEDLYRIASVRSAIGDCELRLDANGAWSVSEAKRALQRLAQFRPSFCEQPVKTRGELIELSRDVAVPLAADECLALEDSTPLLSSGVAIWVLKPMALGGLLPSHRVAMAAIAQGKRVVITTCIDSVLARIAAAHLASALPEVLACGLATARLLARDLAEDPSRLEDGRMKLCDSIGIGVVPNLSEASWRVV
jgi:o-succinylbenzoate synthase